MPASAVQHPPTVGTTSGEKIPVEQAPPQGPKQLRIFAKKKQPTVKIIKIKNTEETSSNNKQESDAPSSTGPASSSVPAASPDTSSFAQKYQTDKYEPDDEKSSGLASLKCVLFRQKPKHQNSYCARARTHRGRQPRNRIVGDIHYDAAAQRVWDEGRSLREGSSVRNRESPRFSRRSLRNDELIVVPSSSTRSSSTPFFFSQELTPVPESDDERPSAESRVISSLSTKSRDTREREEEEKTEIAADGETLHQNAVIAAPTKPLLDRGKSDGVAQRLALAQSMRREAATASASIPKGPYTASPAPRQSWTFGERGGGAFANKSPSSSTVFAMAHHGHMRARVDSLDESESNQHGDHKHLSATNFRELFLSSNASGLQHACIEVATTAAKEAEANTKRARERTLQLYRLEILLQTRLLEVVLQDQKVLGRAPHPTRIAGIHRRKGRLEALCGEKKRAEGELRSALQVTDDPLRHKSLRLLARLLARQGLLHDAERFLRQAIVWEKQEIDKLDSAESTIRRRPGTKERAHTELVSTYVELAVTVEQRGDYLEAIAILDYATTLLPSFEDDEESKSAPSEGIKTDGYLLSTIYGRMGLTMEKLRGYEEDAIVALTKAYVLCLKMERLPSLKRIQKHLQHFDLDKKKTSEMARLLQRRLISLAGKMADANSACSDSVTKDHLVTYLEDLFDSPTDPTSSQLIDARTRAKRHRQKTKEGKLPPLAESESDEASQEFVDAISTEHGLSTDEMISIEADANGKVNEIEKDSTDKSYFSPEEEESSDDSNSYDTPEPVSPEFLVDDDENDIDAALSGLLKKETMIPKSAAEDPADDDLSMASSISSTAGDFSSTSALGAYLDHKKKDVAAGDHSQAGHVSKFSKNTVMTAASTTHESTNGVNEKGKVTRSNILAHGADAALDMDLKEEGLPKSSSKASLTDSSLLALGVVSLASMGYFNSEESDVQEDEEFFTKLGTNIDALRKAERQASL